MTKEAVATIEQIREPQKTTEALGGRAIATTVDELDSLFSQPGIDSVDRNTPEATAAQAKHDRRVAAEVAWLYERVYHDKKSAFDIAPTDTSTDRAPRHLETLDDNEEAVAPERRLGRLALDSLKKIDTYAALATPWIIDKFGGKSRDEHTAHQQYLDEKYATSEDDTWYKRGWNTAMRNRQRIRDRMLPYGVVGYIGAIAVSRAIPGALDMWDDWTGPRSVHADHDTLAVVHRYDTKMVVAGGAGQGHDAPDAEIQRKGLDNSIYIEEVRYSAEIGPVVGQDRMDQSAAGGTRDMYQKSIDDVRAGRDVHLVGYSEGSLVAIDTANAIAAENGGRLPDNVKLTLIGSPYTENGIFNSSFGRAADPMLDRMGIPTNRTLPPGTEVVYYDSDPYANGANMNASTLLKSFLEIQAGSHDIPGEGYIHEFTDASGVVHKVYTRDEAIVRLMQANGIHVQDTASANAAIRSFFPIGTNGEPLPADFRGGLAHTATALDHQIDPSGNTHVVRRIIEQMPEEFKVLGQSGFDSVNNISDAAARMANGEMDPMTGMGIINNEVNHLIGSIQAAIPNPEAGHTPVRDWGANAAGAVVKDYSGQDYTPQIRHGMDTTIAFAENTAQNFVQQQQSGAVPAPIEQLAPLVNNFVQDVVQPIIGSVAQAPAPTPPAAPQVGPAVEQIAPVVIPQVQDAINQGLNVLNGVLGDRR